MADVEPEEGELSVSFDGRSVTYGFGELDTPVPVYAASVHKSQGSEYPAEAIPVMTQHYAILQRNLHYTAAVERKTDVRVSATAPPATTARTAMFVTSLVVLGRLSIAPTQAISALSV